MCTTEENRQSGEVPGEILHPGCRQLFRHWEQMRGEAASAPREALNLRAIRHIVPWLAILEREADRQVYRWRLAGTGVCHLWGQNLTGRVVLEDFAEFERATCLRLFDTVIGAQQPCIARIRATSGHGDDVGLELLALPVLGRNGGPVHILAGIMPFREPEWLGAKPLAAFELSAARVIWTEPLPHDHAIARLRHHRGGPRRMQRNFLTVISGGREK